nr:hypothetical protein Cbor_119 [Cedratvirus borely]WIL03407.1 hypothetical protein Cplu_114 [Cedratvirus plubellavi]
MDILEKMLRIWDQAGERPYEVLMEQGLYDEFMSILSSSTICTEDLIYRGTMRHLDLQVGDRFTYSYPTSWTADIKVATNFIEPGRAILCIEPSCLRALPNPYNSYGEEEFILYPASFQVFAIETYHGTFGDYTLVHLQPV